MPVVERGIYRERRTHLIKPIPFFGVFEVRRKLLEDFGVVGINVRYFLRKQQILVDEAAVEGNQRQVL
jgi:hypothetical protein